MPISNPFVHVMLWLGNTCLLAVFTLAGIAKLRDPNRARESLTGFGVPARWAQSVVTTLALIELLIAAMLAFPPTQPAGAVAALCALVVFTAAISVQLLRGRRPACACFGALTQTAISWRSVGRNLLLMVLAASLVTFPAVSTASIPLDALPLPALLMLAWVGLSAAWLLLLTRQNGRLLLRIEQLEQRALASPATSPQSAPLPRPTDLTGQAAPALTLNDVTGRRIDWQSLRGAPTVLLFLDSTCRHCRSLLSRLRTWQPAAQAIVVLAGQQPQLVELARDIAVVTDDAPSVMQAFGVFWRVQHTHCHHCQRGRHTARYASRRVAIT